MHRHLSKLKNKKTLIAVLACLGIILTTVGVTVAWFTYARNGQKENSITSGKITFIYQENEGVGNGISLTDAMPMPDSYGKTQENKFDFKVTSTSGTSKIPYEITLRKTDNSDDIGNTVKVYLTKVDGANEEQKVLSMYSNLSNSTNTIASINNEKTLYQAEIPAGASNYTDNYRLRMWLNDNPSDGNVLSYQQTVTQECTNTTYTTKETCEEAGEKWLDKATPATEKNFTVKVNVYAEGEAANAEEIAGADSTSIRNISIGNTNATLNTDETQNYDYVVTTTSSNVAINVDTSNTNATATVTPYEPTAMNTKVRRLSTSSNQSLTNGDNYFKITVTSANKAKTKDYILKVTKEASYTSYTFNYATNDDGTGKIQTFVVPYTGNYKLEVWGAGGGYDHQNSNEGYGGYSSGIAELIEGDTYYIVVGGQGETCNTTGYCSESGGFNGGGNAYYDGQFVAGGGGATHIAKDSGELKELSSHSTDGRILIVAGGGGGAGYANFVAGIGGNGGGVIGVTGTASGGDYSTLYSGTGGSQSTGGVPYNGGSTTSQFAVANGQFGQGGQHNAVLVCAGCGNSGGGGGYYGGGASTRGHNGAGGGSGYLSTTLLNNSDKKMYCLDCQESTDTATYTVNTSPSKTTPNPENRDLTNCPSGYSANPIAKCAKSGNGYARITYLSD